MLEQRLHDALVGGVAAVHESPDLFARVVLSIEDDRRRRRQRLPGRAASSPAWLGALAARPRSPPSTSEKES